MIRVLSVFLSVYVSCRNYHLTGSRLGRKNVVDGNGIMPQIMTSLAGMPL